MNAKTPSPLFRIPPERALQLEQIREHEGCASMSATIGKLLEWAREYGKIDHEIPGIEVNVAADGIALKIGDSERAALSFESAAELVETIRRAADLSEPAPTVVNMNDPTFLVGRRGQHSIKIAVPFGETPKQLSTDIALELAELISREINRHTNA